MAQKKEELKSKCKRLLVAAIDFGTTYSGYAFSWKGEWRKVIHQTLHSDKYVSSKAPTTLLLNPDKSFCAFGFGAENTYTDISGKNKSDSDSEERTTTSTPSQKWKDYYYFQRFKMFLHENETLHRDSQITDISGKAMKAMDIFSICIKHLKDSLLEEINKKVACDILVTDIDFVITVPAIWGDAAKMFMREAAVKAGIQTDQLTLALEPEAASIFCQFCQPRNQDENTFDHFDAFRQLVKEKRKYMVIDLGGGTGDITVHKQADDGFLEEVIPATGGPIGGTTVDRAFEIFLETIGGNGILQIFKQAFMEDYLILFTEFEAKKRAVSKKVRVIVPLELERLIENNCKKSIAEILEESKYKGDVTYKQQKLVFELSVFNSFFSEAREGVIKCVEDILKDDSCVDISDIIMVGGLSESNFIQKSLREKFQSYRFLIPDQPGLVVLKGAVYFGHIPHAISKRVCRYTYGVQICRKFLPGDPESRKIVLGGLERCSGVLQPIIRRGDRIEAGLERSHAFQTLEHKEGNFKCGFYVSDKRDTKFVDDKDCRLLGILTVEIPNTKRDHPPELEETFIFGETELTFRAKHLGSGLPIECRFDMLDNSKLPQKPD